MNDNCYRHNSSTCDCDDLGIKESEENLPDCYCKHAKLQHSGPDPRLDPCNHCLCPDYISNSIEGP